MNFFHSPFISGPWATGSAPMFGCPPPTYLPHSSLALPVALHPPFPQSHWGGISEAESQEYLACEAALESPATTSDPNSTSNFISNLYPERLVIDLTCCVRISERKKLKPLPRVDTKDATFEELRAGCKALVTAKFDPIHADPKVMWSGKPSARSAAKIHARSRKTTLLIYYEDILKVFCCLFSLRIRFFICDFSRTRRDFPMPMP